jgi:hypothetical protein
VLATVPAEVWSITELRNRGGSLDWATDWLRMTPQRLFSFAELARPGATSDGRLALAVRDEEPGGG